MSRWGLRLSRNYAGLFDGTVSSVISQVKAVTLAIGRDGSSGGCVRTVVVNEEGDRRDFLAGSKLELYGEKAPLPQPVTASA